MYNYFKNKNYIAFYLNNFGTKFASTLVLSFTGAYFYDTGIKLYLILLYFGFEFGFRAFFSPFAGIISSKIGFRKTIILSYFILILYFITIALINKYFWIGFFGFLLHSISRGLYYPIRHLTQALFIDSKERGKFLTFEMVMTTLIGMFAIFSASFIVLKFDSFFPIVILSSFFLLISIFAIYFLLDEQNPNFKDFKNIKTCKNGNMANLQIRENNFDNLSFKKIYSFLFSLSFRKDFLAYCGFSTNIVINNVIISLITFYYLKDFKTFSLVMNLVLFFELIFTIFFGFYIDKNNLQATKKSSFLQFLSYIGYIFLIKNPISLFFLQSFYKIVWNFFDTSFTARFHSKIKSSQNPTIYACAKEMILGYFMFFVLILASFLSLFLNNKIFILFFLFGMCGIYFLNIYFKD